MNTDATVDKRKGRPDGLESPGVSGSIRVLLLEGDPNDADLIARELNKLDAGIALRRVETREDFEAALEDFRADIVLLDYNQPAFDGTAALRMVRQRHPEIPAVMVTPPLGDEAAIELLMAGARDNVLKSNLVRLVMAVRRAISIEAGIRVRKSAERAVRASELRYRRLFEAAECGILILDGHSGVVVDANPFLTGRLGYSREELQGKLLWEIGLFESAEASSKVFSELQTRSYVRCDDVKLRRKSASPLDVEFVINSYDVDGLRVYQCNIRDVSERKRVEQDRAFNAAVLTAIQRVSPDGILLVDPHEKILNYNPRFAELWEIPSELLATGSDRRLLEAVVSRVADAPAFVARVKELYADRVATGHEEIRFADGRIMERDTAPITLDDGTYVGRVWFFRDVTERLRTQQLLASSEHRFRAMIENSPDIIVVADARGMMNYVSASMRVLGGYSVEELRGHSVFEFMDPEGVEGFKAQFSALVARPDVVARREGHYRLKDGRLRMFESVARNLLHDPAVGGIVVNLRDITERKAQEKVLAKVNRALLTLSTCNSAVVHAVSEEQLLRVMCRTVVETGGYKAAWVGFKELDQAKSVRPVAWAGTGEEYIRQPDITWDDTELGGGPAGRCIRSGMLQVTREIEADPSMAPWRARAKQFGYQSSLTLPLIGPIGAFGTLTIYAGDPDAFDNDEQALLSEMVADLSYGITSLRTREDHAQGLLKLERSMEGTVHALAGTVETRDPYTAGHQRRVAALATAIAREMGLDEYAARGLELAATVHDIGKINVPAEILAKPGKLSRVELELVKGHAEAGYQILKDVEFPWPIAEMIRQHHERLDGSGYPRGLEAEQILPEAKILAVADVVEAMSSHRPYRPGKGVDAALEEITRGRGTFFDAAAVDACVKLFHERGYKIPE